MRVARDGLAPILPVPIWYHFFFKNDYQIEDPRHRKLFLLQKQRGCRDRLEVVIGAVTRQDPQNFAGDCFVAYAPRKDTIDIH